MKLSPIERRAANWLAALPHMWGLLLSQLQKGRERYGGPIDRCGYDRARMLEEAGREAVDLLVYLEAADAPPPIVRGVALAAAWIEAEG